LRQPGRIRKTADGAEAMKSKNRRSKAPAVSFCAQKEIEQLTENRKCITIKCTFRPGKRNA
ncbi:MAG TPA: hypothetical protein H9682_03680, partial [Firmicutes bacterium]|nr:hypothetical protein [Bacillota bacterium]